MSGIHLTPESVTPSIKKGTAVDLIDSLDTCVPATYARLRVRKRNGPRTLKGVLDERSFRWVRRELGVPGWGPLTGLFLTS